MKFYSKFANLQVLVDVGNKITFKNGVYEATKAEEKVLKGLPEFGRTIWCDKQVEDVKLEEDKKSKKKK